MSQLVFCRFCEQEFFSTSVEECPLCRKVGGLMPVDVIEAIDASTAASESPPPANASAPVPAPADQSAFRMIRWTWTHLLVGILGLLVPHAVLWLGRRDILPRTPETLLLAIILGVAWCLLFPLWVALRVKPRTQNLFRRQRLAIFEVALAVPVTIGLYAILLLVALLMDLLFGDAGLMQDVTEGMRRAPYVSATLLAILVLGAIAAPIAEEVFFRGMIYNLLRQRWHFAAALVTQALVFAVVHVQPFVNLVYIFIIGLLLALVYEWRRTLWAPIFVHAAVNSVGFTYVLVAVIGNANAPFLGISCDDRNDGTGCVVKTVFPGTAAEEAGLQVGDVIVGFNREGIWNFRHLTELIRAREVGEQVTVQFYRGEMLHEITARLQRRQATSE